MTATAVRRFRSIRLFGAGCLLLLAAIAGSVWVVGRSDQERLLAAVSGRLSEALGRPVAVGGIQISFPEGEFVLRGLHLGREPTDVGPAPPAISIDEIRGNLGLWSLALARLHFESLAVEGLSFRGRYDGSQPRSDSGSRGSGFETLAGRLSFSSERFSVSGTTISYRNVLTPWEVRADQVAFDFRVTEKGGVDGEVRSELGVIRLQELSGVPTALAMEFRIRGNRLHLDRLELQTDLLAVNLNGSLDLSNKLAGTLRVVGSADAGGLSRFLFDFEGMDTRGSQPLRFDGTAGLREDGLVVDGELMLPGGRLYGVPLGDWKGRVHWGPERLEVLSSAGFVAGGAATLRALQVNPAEENPAEIALTVRDASMASIVEGLFGTPTALRSLVTLDADLRVPFADPLLLTGTIEATGDPAEAGPGELPFGFEAELALDEEAVEVRRFAATGAAFQSTLKGQHSRAGNADFMVRGFVGDWAEVDAAQQEFRRVFFGEDPGTTFWDVSGAGGLEGTVRGRWPDLVIEGEVEGQTMRFSTIHTDTLLVAGRLDPDAIRINSLSARAGSGADLRLGILRSRPRRGSGHGVRRRVGAVGHPGNHRLPCLGNRGGGPR